MIRRFVSLSPFPGSDPNREDDHNGKSPDEGTKHKDIAVVRVGREAEELRGGCQKWDLVETAIAIDSQGSS